MKLTFEVWPNMPWGRLEAAGPAWNSWGDKPLGWCAERIAECGYDGIDVIFPKILQEDYPSFVEEFPAKLRELGLEFGYIGAHSTFVSPRHFDRERGIASFKQAVDAAADLGAKSVCTLLGDGYYDPPLNILLSRKDAWAQAVGAVDEVAAHAADKGVNVSIELLQGSIVNRVPLLLRLIEEVDRDNVRATVDTGTFYTTVKPFMDVKEAIREIGDLIDLVHVKDEIGLPSIVQTNHTWMGGGLVDFGEVREALDEIGFSATAAWSGRVGRRGGPSASASPPAWGWRTSIGSPSRRRSSWRSSATGRTGIEKHKREGSSVPWPREA
jgi:sugar phosphate isomerase/epimerase